MSHLSDKQERFCNEYLIDLNATKAAARAGYSEKTARAIGHENLTKPDIQCRMTELQRQRGERLKVDADFVIQGLMENVAICMAKADMVVTDRKTGEQYRYRDYQPLPAIRALELLGKHLGLFVERHEVDTEVAGFVVVPAKALDDG